MERPRDLSQQPTALDAMLASSAGVKLLRRISTKLVVAVLTTVILPFVAFAFFINEQMAERLTRHVVQQSLIGLSKDLAGQLNYFVEERRQDLEQWAESPLTIAAIEDAIVERQRLDRIARGESGDDGTPRWDAQAVVRASSGETTVEERFDASHHWNRALWMREQDRLSRIKAVYDVVLLIDDRGRLVTCTSRDPADPTQVLELDYIEHLFERDYSNEAWFREALSGQLYMVDHHVSPLRIHEYGGDDVDTAWNYHLGFAAPVRTSGEGDVQGVLFALVNWWFLQEIVSTPVLKDAFRGLVEPPEDPSPYAWIWASDADTIYAHPLRRLYYQSVSALGLPQLHQAVIDDDDDVGLYPEYEFDKKEKNAAFVRTDRDGGFGWVVGVGIDNDDIYATADELRLLLLGGTALVLLVAVGWTFVIAKRTTGPILDLQRSVRRVASGDLDSRADIRSRDELGALAEDFNSMTRELKSQREQLIKAEKDAAWREMARQIAHDIKNPLTPIKLSLDLLERVRRENAPGSEEILERTMALMNRQVDHLREIAGDFYEFTGGRKPRPVALDLGELLDEVLHLHDAWAVRQGVEVQREGETVVVWADRAKMQRVFVNLVSNALQAMPEGGELLLDVRAAEGMGIVEIRDTGVGIPEEAREHLFEPYFTTKSEGTGLGLAISRRVVEESGGSIELAPRHPSERKGTVAYVSLPLHTGRETA